MTIAAVILDMDGLMVDTEPLYKDAWQRAVAELDCDLDDDTYAMFVGRPNRDCERLLLERFGPGFRLSTFRERWPVLWRDAVTDVVASLAEGRDILTTLFDA